MKHIGVTYAGLLSINSELLTMIARKKQMLLSHKSSMTEKTFWKEVSELRAVQDEQAIIQEAIEILKKYE